MQNHKFNNFFTRIAEPRHFKVNFQGLPLHVNQLFTNTKDLYLEALNAEVSMFSDSGSRNQRSIFSEINHFSFLSNTIGNIKQTSMLFPCIYLSFIIASNVQLRSLFNDQVKSDHHIPEFVNRIFKYIRSTNSPSLTINFSNSKSNLVHTYGWQNTIFDPDYLLMNDDARQTAFTLVTGSYFKHVYRNIRFVSYEHVSFSSNMSTVTSIKTSYSSNSYSLRIYNFSNVKQINSMFDPTTNESATAFFGGCCLTDRFGNVPEIGPSNTKFRVDVSQSSFFYSMFSFYLEDSGQSYTNPKPKDDTIQLPKPKRKVSLEKKTNDSVLLQTNQNDNNNEINNINNMLKFANNLYNAGLKSYFTQFVRKNKLHNQCHYITNWNFNSNNFKILKS